MNFPPPQEKINIRHTQADPLPSQKAPLHSASLAIILALVAYAAYSTGDAMGKLLVQHNAPAVLMAFNGTVGCLVSFIWLALTKRLPLLWRTPRLKLHLLRALFVGVLVWLAISALKLIPLADFYGIIFLSPFVVVLLAHFVFHEEIGLHRLLAIIGGFIGVLVVAGPKFEDPNIGYVLTFLMVFFVAGHVLTVRRLGTHDPLPVTNFFPGFGILMVALPQLFFHPALPTPTDLPLMGIYAAMIVVGQMAFAYAYAVAPLTAVVAPFVYTQMLWGIFFGIVLFQQPPSLTTLIGASIVIASGLGLIFFDAYRNRRARKRRKEEDAVTASIAATGHQSL